MTKDAYIALLTQIIPTTPQILDASGGNLVRVTTMAAEQLFMWSEVDTERANAVRRELRSLNEDGLFTFYNPTR